MFEVSRQYQRAFTYSMPRRSEMRHSSSASDADIIPPERRSRTRDPVSNHAGNTELSSLRERTEVNYSMFYVFFLKSCGTSLILFSSSLQLELQKKHEELSALRRNRKVRRESLTWIIHFVAHRGVTVFFEIHFFSLFHFSS